MADPSYCRRQVLGPCASCKHRKNMHVACLSAWQLFVISLRGNAAWRCLAELVVLTRITTPWSLSLHNKSDELPTKSELWARRAALEFCCQANCDGCFFSSGVYTARFPVFSFCCACSAYLNEPCSIPVWDCWQTRCSPSLANWRRDWLAVIPLCLWQAGMNHGENE